MKGRISIAPMMDWTDRYYRYFMRLLTHDTWLYSEMVTTGAILYGDKNRHLDYSPCEHPLALQLGGDDPTDLARTAEIGAQMGYDEININIGCPSERVQKGSFGACLMGEPKLVAQLCAAMQSAVSIPVTVKHRIGIDGRESYADLRDFVRTVADAGPRHFIVHARIAILKGLSPKENRTVPPLRYDDVYRLKNELSAEYEGLHIEINGGIRTWAEAARHLQHVDSVMIGRAAYENPAMFSVADDFLKQTSSGFDMPETFRLDDLRYDEIISDMASYTDDICRSAEHTRPMHIIRHMMGLFHGVRGTKAFKRYLSEHLPKAHNGDVLRRAWDEVQKNRRPQAS